VYNKIRYLVTVLHLGCLQLRDETNVRNIYLT